MTEDFHLLSALNLPYGELLFSNFHAKSLQMYLKYQGLAKHSSGCLVPSRKLKSDVSEAISESRINFMAVKNQDC